MDVYIYMCIYIYENMYMCIYIYIYEIYIYIYMYTHTCIDVHILYTIYIYIYPNPFVATHHSKDSTGPIYAVCVKNGALFGRPQGRSGRDPRIQEGSDAPWREESAHKAPRQGSP